MTRSTCQAPGTSRSGRWRLRRSREVLTLQLPAPAELETKLEELGISDASRIVVYMGKDWISPLTRVVFTLDYAGLGGQTMVLDGGLPAWKAAGKAVTTDVPAPPAAGTLTIKARPEAVADLAWVQSHAGKPGSVVIDARNTQFYPGESNNNGRIPRPGHVAGAVSAPFDTWVREDGSFKPRAELEAMLKAAAPSPARPSPPTVISASRRPSRISWPACSATT